MNASQSGIGDRQGVYAVIPALNERETIASVVKAVRDHAGGVVVVDDGSRDGTGQIAAAHGAHTIVHEVNQGYDRSIDDGFRYVSMQQDARIVFTFDADGQHRAEVLQHLLRPLLNAEADIVVGTRPRMARLAEKLLARYTRVRYGIVDPLCGLKAYRIEVYRDVGFFDRISSIGTELLLRGIRRGYRVKQLPVPVEPRADRSRFGQALKGNYKIFMALVRIVTRIR